MGMNRRSFVKASLGAGVLGAGAAAAYGMGKPLALTGGTQAVKVEFLGAKRVGGPAPRGLPILPLELDSEGNIIGQIVETDGGLTNLDWYQYCGHEDAPGLQAEVNFPDNLVRYFITPDKIAQGFNPWYADLVGNPMNVNDFPDVGFGAAGNWRSEGQTGAGIITAIVVNVGKDLDNVGGTGNKLTFEDADQWADPVRAQVEETGLLGFVSFCSHFCCVPGWKEADKSLADSKNAWDTLFCTCHFSVYDPAVLKVDNFLKIVEIEEEEA